MNQADWDDRYGKSALVWSAGPNQFLVTEADGLEPKRAVDLAAGEGRNAIWLAERGWRVGAVDYSEVGLDKGRQIAEKRGIEVEWIHADLATHTPEEHGYDLVLIMYLHLPWPEMVPILRRAASAVAPGGTFLLVGHALSNLEEGHGGPPNPAVLYEAEQVAGELGDLEILKAVQVTRDVETEGGTVQAIDCLVRATRRSG